jgi:hypothetical protein
MAFEYAIIQAYKSGSWTPIITLAFIIVILLLLFVVEGAEIAVAGLLDKDPEQIHETHLRNTLSRLQQDSEGFFAGRQLLVVASIVILTSLSNSLATFSQADSYENIILVATMAEPTRQAFKFVFPIFIVLWYAQLLPKFLGQESPLRMFSSSITQLFITTTLLLGKTQIGAPSQYIKKLLSAWFARNPNSYELLPSRAAHYKVSAALNSGRGLKHAHVEIEIGPQGNTSVKSEFLYEAFGQGFSMLSGDNGWGKAIKNNSFKVELLELPQKAGVPTISGPTIYDVTMPVAQGFSIPAQITSNGIKWGIRFPTPIRKGEKFKYRISYETENGALESEVGKADYYVYTVKASTGTLIITVIPASDSGFALTGGKLKIVKSGETETDDLEGQRVTTESYKSGYRFQIKYPLEGTKLTLQWEIGQPIL